MPKLLSRWRRSSHQHGSPPATSSQCGPDASLLQSLLQRLLPEDSPAPSWQQRADDPALLARVHLDFVASLADVPATEELRRGIDRARRLEDFWHLRGWLYTAVAQAHSQTEAERRLACLHRHFSGSLDELLPQPDTPGH